MGNIANKTHVKERGENSHSISRWETEEKVTYHSRAERGSAMGNRKTNKNNATMLMRDCR